MIAASAALVATVGLCVESANIVGYLQQDLTPGVKTVNGTPCIVCGGAGCRVCKGSGWIEIAGAGLVNPAVFANVGYDVDKVSGFAFGFGLERIAMIRYGINDLRLLYDNDVRFLHQF